MNLFTVLGNLWIGVAFIARLIVKADEFAAEAHEFYHWLRGGDSDGDGKTI
jgi:hypothetical protein